jgi:hypothetical protein
MALCSAIVVQSQLRAWAVNSSRKLQRFESSTRHQLENGPASCLRRSGVVLVESGRVRLSLWLRCQASSLPKWNRWGSAALTP